MTFKEKISFNLKLETWKDRLDYYVFCMKGYLKR